MICVNGVRGGGGEEERRRGRLKPKLCELCQE